MYLSIVDPFELASVHRLYECPDRVNIFLSNDTRLFNSVFHYIVISIDSTRHGFRLTVNLLNL